MPEDEATAQVKADFTFEDFGAASTVQTTPVANAAITMAPMSQEQELIQRLNAQLTQMDEKVAQLSSRLQSYLPSDSTVLAPRNGHDNQVIETLSKWGFRDEFCGDFIAQYTSPHWLLDTTSEEALRYALQSHIKTAGYELIDAKGVIALVGPTGIGKTTTIAKLATRYISQHGPDDLGLITTNYQDIASINQMLYHNNLLGVDIEYANSALELAAALEKLRDKKLVLIDTYGVSQRDQRNLHTLRQFLTSQGDKIATYITLPCNVQDDILQAIAREFKTDNTRGCILTKEDECFSMAPAISACITQDLNIAYICNGQNLSNDIRVANARDIMHKLVADANAKPVVPKQNTFKNAGILSTLLNEGSYARQSI
jgi:flagellar biosynthesis protein FlhF